MRVHNIVLISISYRSRCRPRWSVDHAPTKYEGFFFRRKVFKGVVCTAGTTSSATPTASTARAPRAPSVAAFGMYVAPRFASVPATCLDIQLHVFVFDPFYFDDDACRVPGGFVRVELPEGGQQGRWLWPVGSHWHPRCPHRWPQRHPQLLERQLPEKNGA